MILRLGTLLATALAVVFVFSVTAAHAIDPAAKCEASKNKIAGKYYLCREKGGGEGNHQGKLA